MSVCEAIAEYKTVFTKRPAPLCPERRLRGVVCMHGCGYVGQMEPCKLGSALPLSPVWVCVCLCLYVCESKNVSVKEKAIVIFENWERII